MKRKYWLKKNTIVITIIVMVSVFLTGCGVKKIGKEDAEVQKMEYTVVEELSIPEELKELIEEKKIKEFQVSFASGKELYLAVGYGEQETGGYSIVVERLEETPEAVYFETNLLGPDKDEKVSQRVSYPYIVVKTEYRDKDIFYE